jgi:hypothetical protein
MEQNAKAHKEEECTSDWRNPEKIQRKNCTLWLAVSLSGVAVLLFSNLPSGGS